MRQEPAKHVTTVTVTDPDTLNPVELSIIKLEGGGMIGIDASFLANTEEPLYSPFDHKLEIDTDNL